MSRFNVEIANRAFEIEFVQDKNELWAVVDGKRHRVELTPEDERGRFTLSFNEKKIPVALTPNERGYQLYAHGRAHDVVVERSPIRALREHLKSSETGAMGAGVVESHMPGLIVKIHVQPGQVVSEGDALLVIEAMKMENEIRAPISGVVDSIAVEEGKEVSGGATLCILKPESAHD